MDKTIKLETEEDTIFEKLEHSVININYNIDILDQFNTGDKLIEIKGDALNALGKSLRNSIKELNLVIHMLDKQYRLTPVDYKYTPDKYPYICNCCGKPYNSIDFDMLEDKYGDNPCNECGCEEYTKKIADGTKTMTIGKNRN